MDIKPLIWNDHVPPISDRSPGKWAMTVRGWTFHVLISSESCTLCIYKDFWKPGWEVFANNYELIGDFPSLEAAILAADDRHGVLVYDEYIEPWSDREE